MNNKTKRARTIVIAVVLVAIIALSSFALYYLQLRSQNISGEQFGQVSILNSQIQKHKYVTEYAIKNESSPLGIAVDASGNVWFTLGNETSLVELNPSNGTAHEFQLPEPKNATLTTWGIAVDNSRNLVWFTDATQSAVWRFNTTSHSFLKYQLGQGSFPLQIALTQNGTVWFTELYANRIGAITTQGKMSEYSVPPTSNVNNTGPTGLTLDQSGTVWFTETFANAVCSFSDGQFHSYPLNGLVLYPTGIAVDSKGNLWITEHGPSFVSEFNPSTHYFRTISTSIPPLNSSLPYFVHVDSHDNVWFNEHNGNSIGMFSPKNNTIVEYEVPSRVAILGNISAMLTFALSPSGQPWFTEMFTGKVGTVDVSEPLDVKLAVSGVESVALSTNSSATLKLGVNSTIPVAMAYSLGNFTNDFQFTFTPALGSGNFVSVLDISALNSRPGTYYATLSAKTPDLVVSQVVSINVA